MNKERLALCWTGLLAPLCCASLIACGSSQSAQGDRSSLPVQATQGTGQDGEGEGAIGSSAVTLEGTRASSTDGATGTSSARELVLQAEKQLERKQYELAIERSKSALKRDEKYTPAMVVMALAYFRLGKTEFASAICSIATGIDPANGECANLDGFIALDEGRSADALQAFKNATERNPKLGTAWLNLGAQYVVVKNYEEAVGAAEKAVELLPNRSGAWLNLGAAYRGVGKLVEAQKAFRKALELKPKLAAAEYNLGLLYLDAEEYPGIDTTKRLTLAINHLRQFKKYAKGGEKTQAADSFVSAAERALDREQSRIEREKRKAEREKAKQAKAAKEPPNAGAADPATSAVPAEANQEAN
jgi:Tfp pilus assembly protein PilF